MNDIAKKKAELEKAEALLQLKAIGMSEDVADMVYRQMESYRNLIGVQDPSVLEHNPLDLTDIEILDGAWVFSAEGINFFRLAVDEPFQEDYIAYAAARVGPSGRFSPDEATSFVKHQFDAWMTEQSACYGVGSEDDYSANLVMGSFYFAYLLMHSSEVRLFRREAGGLTVIFNISHGFGDIRTVRLDYYQDVWEKMQK